MAEPVGLALGTVALASLFTTSIELIDYFELRRSYEYDYELACLKVSLLKSRLDTWGRALKIFDNTGLGKPFREDWPLEETVVQRSLLGIADIFGNAEHLKDKYKLVPCKSRNIITSSTQEAQGLIPDRKVRGHFIKRHCRPSCFRRSTTWAIRDKQKFDALISDLDFFISSLEAISLPSHTTGTTPPSSTMSNQASPTPPADCADGAADPRATPAIRARCKMEDRSARAIVIQKPNPHQTPTEVPCSSGDNQPNSKSHTQEGYSWLVGKMQDRSGAFFGLVAGAKLEPAPTGQVVSFKTEVTKDDSRLMGGAMCKENFDNFFNTTAREKAATSTH